jgi:hypothetical protein
VIRTRDELWNAVNDALDVRRDPLTDSAVQAWIAEHPEDLEEFLRLGQGLRTLAGTPRTREVKPVLALVSVAALVLALVSWLRDEGPTWRERHSGTRSAVLEYRIQVSTDTPDTHVVATLENGNFTRGREQRISTDDAVAHVTITTRKEGLR